MLRLRKGPSAHTTALAMVAARSGDEAVVLGADVADLAAELARVTGLNGRTLVVDAAEPMRANVEHAAAEAGSLVEFDTVRDGRLPLADAAADVVVISPASCAALVRTTDSRDLAEVARALRGGGRIVALVRQRRTGLAAMFDRAAAPPVDPAEVIRLIGAAGLRAARLLGEADGLAFVEAMKPRTV